MYSTATTLPVLGVGNRPQLLVLLFCRKQQWEVRQTAAVSVTVVLVRFTRKNKRPQLLASRSLVLVMQHGKVRDALSLSAIGHCAGCPLGSRGGPQPWRTRHVAGGGDFPREELRTALLQSEIHSAIGATVARGKESLTGANRTRREQQLQTTDLRRNFTPVFEDVF